MILNSTFLTAFAGALLVLALPAAGARWIALVAALAGLAAAVVAFASFDGAGFQFLTNVPWVGNPRIAFHTGADGISLVLLLLTGIIAVTGVLFSWNVTHRPKTFFCLFLLIIGGSYGVFQSLDLFLLFVFYEIVILPKFFLITGWGSTNRAYGAMKLTIYSVAGSALVLGALLATYAASGLATFDLLQLADPARQAFAPAFQTIAFPVMFLGFGILAGLWPFHTWAPTGHVAAPTAVSMLLAGVVMKLGSYAALRVAMPLFPSGLDQWRLTIAILAAAGIVYGALAALAQRDLKFVVGYSSVSHMGFVLLGLATLNATGLGGSVLQMFSHGIIGGLLFAVVGRMIYDRAHTRDIGALGKLGLARSLPFAAFTFVIASLASMGLPGFSGFIAELAILLGSLKAFPVLLAVAAVGILLTVGFTLRTLQLVFFPATNGVEAAPAPMEPITFPEKIAAAILMLTTLAVGLFPGFLLHPILRSLEHPMFQQILKGGAL